MNQEIIKRILSSIIIVAIALFFIIKGSFFYIFFLSIFFFITSFEWYKMTKNNNYFLFGFILLILSFFSAFLFRNTGQTDFLLVILICASTDIGGFLFGKIFKGPKLTKISPNKTISGSIGSFIFSLSLVPVFYNLLKSHNFISLILITIAISFTAQLGDLFISYLKRKAQVKDTSDILPGHGGFLDRVDGLIFAIPLGTLLFRLL